MKMWVTNRPWKDIVAMIEKLWSSSRGKQRQETILEVDEEEDEVLKDREDEKEPRKDVNGVHKGTTKKVTAPTAPLVAPLPAMTNSFTAAAASGETDTDGESTK